MQTRSFLTASRELIVEHADRSLAIVPEIHFGNVDHPTVWRPLQEAHWPAGTGNLRIEARHEAFDFVLEVADEAGFAILSARLSPRQRESFHLHSIVWQSRRTGAWPAADKLVRRSLTYDVWGECRIRPVNEPVPPSHSEYWRTAIFEPDREEESMVWSVKLPAAWVHRFSFDGECTLITLVNVDLPPGAVWENDPMAIGLRGDVETRLAGPKSFQVARTLPAEQPLHAAWNSWDYYHLSVSENDILENLEQLRRHDWLRDLVRYVIIDDGWEDQVGKWDANPRFGRGMDWIAGEIRQAGFVPGLWAAPFFVEKGAPIFDTHPEYCVQHDGVPFSPFALLGCEPPWGDRCYLDPTRPEVADHIYQTWRKFYSWGYRYFKTDFLSNPFQLTDQPGPDWSGRLTFHNSQTGLHRGHRRCMQAIRAAIGEESFWLGCGSIWATGPGLMNASRISADIAIQWKNLLHCGQNAFLNQHAHGRLWLNDPDFLVVRGSDTAHPHLLEPIHDPHPLNSRYKKERLFTLDEARMWAAIVLLSGGLVVLSDRLACLNEQGLEILKTVAGRLNGAPGRVLRRSGEQPRIVLQNSPRGRLLGIFNWSDAPAPALRDNDSAIIPEGTWTDLWSRRPFSSTAAWQDLHLDGHSCALLAAD